MKNIGKTINLILLLILITILLFVNKRQDIDHRIETSYLTQNNEIVEPQKLFLNSWKIIKDKYYDPTLNAQNWYYWKNHYLKEIKTNEDAYMAINTIIASLNDPYSKFMTPREYNEQNIDLDAKINGIGVHITTVSGKFLIIGVIENSPAEKAGLNIGDVILKVDNTEVNGKNISDIASAIRGPVNSFVHLEILREDKKINKKIQRKEVKLQSIKTKIINDNIGYIKINSFMSASLVTEFEEAFAKVKDTKGLIIDLRNNPGGVLDNAIILSNNFINKGTIVSIRNRDGRGYPITANVNIAQIEIPTVILVNKGSASASEIFCGALKDHDKAIVIGEKTYGKGMIQKIYSLPNQTGMNITVAKYLTPKGVDINRHGIAPHYIITNDETKPLEEDKQLDKAVSVLEQMI